MYFVYVLKSIDKDFRYVGYTNNLDRRFNEHNLGENQSTKAYSPYVMEAYVAVDSKERAKRLEKYFKTGSGRAVLYKRILMLEKYLKD
jgi:putative endonuclease